MRPVGSSRKSNCNRRKQSWTGPSFTLLKQSWTGPSFTLFHKSQGSQRPFCHGSGSNRGIFSQSYEFSKVIFQSPIAHALYQNCCINKGAEWNIRWLVSLRCVPPLLLAFLWIVLFLSFLVIVPAPPFVFRMKVPRVFIRVSSYPFFWEGHGNHTLLTILSEYHPQR